jgi:hypothetical protein
VAAGVHHDGGAGAGGAPQAASVEEALPGLATRARVKEASVFSRHSRGEPRCAMMSGICMSALPVTSWPPEPYPGSSQRPRCGAGPGPVNAAPWP